jgi:hypothetical protein
LNRKRFWGNKPATLQSSGGAFGSMIAGSEFSSRRLGRMS